LCHVFVLRPQYLIHVHISGRLFKKIMWLITGIVDRNHCSRKPKGQSRMNNPETLATLDTRQIQTIQRHWQHWTHKTNTNNPETLTTLDTQDKYKQSRDTDNIGHTRQIQTIQRHW
jgi:hypothetical protein